MKKNEKWFYEKKSSGGLLRQGYSYFPHKRHVLYQLVTEPPQEGRGFEPRGAGGGGPALPLGPLGTCFRESGFLGRQTQNEKQASRQL